MPDPDESLYVPRNSRRSEQSSPVSELVSHYPWARPARYLMRSLLRNNSAAAWAWQSASRSSNRMADGSGPTATAGVARRSTSPCLRLHRKQTLPWRPRDSILSREVAGPSRRVLRDWYRQADFPLLI